jgi:purine-nucleoside phosphorylase
MLNEIKEATDYLKKHGIANPEIGVILGTGLGNLFVKEIKNPIEINYNSIPHFPSSTVEFHKGKLIYGDIQGKKVLAMQGRFHFYEGYSMQQITLPVRVMKILGVEQLLISNAAGNMNLKWKKGDLMLIDDHINLLPDNPLRGPNYEKFGPRFPDMSQPYSARLNKKLVAIAKKEKVKLHKGVYVGVMGMSTVPEVIVANHMGLPCCAISVLTDDCDPDNLKPANISEIIEIAGKAEKKLTKLYVELIAWL